MNKKNFLVLTLILIFVFSGCYKPENTDKEITPPISDPDPSPEIITFTIFPKNIDEGQSTTIAWETVNATTVKLDLKKENDFDTVENSGSIKIKGIEKSRKFTLKAQTDTESTEQTIEIEVTPFTKIPEIVYFKATPNPMPSGGSTELSWKVLYAQTVEIRTWTIWSQVASKGGWTITGRTTDSTISIRAKNKNGIIEDSFILKVK